MLRSGQLTVSEFLFQSLSISVSQYADVPFRLLLSVPVSQSFCLSVFPSFSLSASLSVCVSVCLPLSLSVSQSFRLSVCLRLSLSASQPSCLRLSLSVSLPVYLSVCLPLCLLVRCQVPMKYSAEALHWSTSGSIWISSIVYFRHSMSTAVEHCLVMDTQSPSVCAVTNCDKSTLLGSPQETVHNVILERPQSTTPHVSSFLRRYWP